MNVLIFYLQITSEIEKKFDWAKISTFETNFGQTLKQHRGARISILYFLSNVILRVPMLMNRV